MRIEHFKYSLNRVNFFYLTDDENIVVFRKPLEIWNANTSETVKFRNVEELLEYEIMGKTVREMVEGMEELKMPHPDGGRGGDSDEQTFKFNHADDDGDVMRDVLFPAKANTRIDSKNFESALADFEKAHGDSDHEWAYEVDEQGYVHKYVEGGKSAVAIGASQKDSWILHNHPGGGAFSDADLLTTAASRKQKGIVAVGKEHNYFFQKGTHFKATEFTKALKNATLKGKSYDDAVDRWLKSHAKKYGYIYQRTNK